MKRADAIMEAMAADSLETREERQTKMQRAETSSVTISIESATTSTSSFTSASSLSFDSASSSSFYSAEDAEGKGRDADIVIYVSLDLDVADSLPSSPEEFEEEITRIRNAC